MATSFKHLVLLENHSSAIFFRAVSEGIVKFYVNERQTKPLVENQSFVEWNDIASALLLHEKVFLTDLDLDPQVTFPNGKATVSFDTKPNPNKSLLNALTDPPSVRNWAFPQVLRASDALSQIMQGDYVQFDLLLDFFRLEQFVSLIIGRQLRETSLNVGSLIGHSMGGLETIKNDRDLALAVGAYALMARLKWFIEKQGEGNSTAQTFYGNASRYPDEFTKLVTHFKVGNELRERMRAEDFQFLTNLFQMFAIKYVPLYRRIIDHAHSSDACILADRRFEQLTHPFVNNSPESDVIGTFRVVLGEGQPWRTSEMSLSDILRVRNEPWVSGFRQSVEKVIRAIGQGDLDLAQAGRDEVMSAREKYRASVGFDKAGSIITYISVPISIIEAFLGTVVGGITCSFVGASSLLCAQSLRKKSQWVAHLP